MEFEDERWGEGGPPRYAPVCVENSAFLSSYPEGIM